MQVVGLVKEVKVIGKKTIRAIAKFDTGAKRTSIDTDLAAKAGLGPLVKTASVKRSGSKTKRIVVKAKIKIGRKTFDADVNLSDRSHSLCKVLIGRDIILGNFIIDVSKTHYGPRETEIKQGVKKRLGLA